MRIGPPPPVLFPQDGWPFLRFGQIISSFVAARKKDGKVQFPCRYHDNRKDTPY